MTVLALLATAVLTAATGVSPEPAVRVAAGGGALVGASTAGLVAASGALALTTSLGAADDPASLAAVLIAGPVAVGLGAFAGAGLVGVGAAWIPAVAGLAGAGLGSSASALLLVTQPALFSDDLGAALVVLVALPTAAGALAAGVAAPFCVDVEE